jgi:hypothetical protein
MGRKGGARGEAVEGSRGGGAFEEKREDGPVIVELNLTLNLWKHEIRHLGNNNL